MIKATISESDLKTVVEALETGRVSMEEILSLTTKEEGDEFVLNIDYSRTLQEMIDAGNYAWVNSDIMQIPLSTEFYGKKISVSGKLLYFDRRISTKEAVPKINKTIYRPATVPELLALGEAYHEIQHRFTIIALGSFGRNSEGYNYVPLLHSGNSEGDRILSCHWSDRYWDPGYRFLGILK